MGGPLTWSILGYGMWGTGAIAGATTGILGATSEYEQAQENAKAQQSMMDYNARLEAREATVEEAEANEAARRQRLENERIKSMQRAAYGKSGVAATSGSPLAVLGESAANMEMGVQDVHRAGALAYNRRMSQSNSFRYQSEVAGKSVNKGMLWGGIGGSLAGGLSGIGGAVAGGAGTYGQYKRNLINTEG